MNRIKAAIARIRARVRFIDHVFAMVEHYGEVRGNILAGGVTYFGFLSFFPILALAFFVIGYVQQVWPGSEDALKKAIEGILPGIISDQDPPPSGQISFQQIQNAKTVAGVVGVVGVLYSGLGWLSALREALVAAFVVPATRRVNFVVGKAIDLVMLIIIGFVLVVSVSIAGVVTGYASDILDWVGLAGTAGEILLYLLAALLGLAASTLLFFTMYRLLPRATVPSKALWQGALLAGIGFELMKQLAFLVLAGAKGSALAPFAVSLTLVVWIYYFARVTTYGACWAYTAVDRSGSPFQPSAEQTTAQLRETGGPDEARSNQDHAIAVRREPPGVGLARPALVIGALAVAFWAWVRREKAGV